MWSIILKHVAGMHNFYQLIAVIDDFSFLYFKEKYEKAAGDIFIFRFKK